MRTVRIPLHSRKYPNLYALIDEADADLVNQYRWRVYASRRTFYVQANTVIDGKATTILLHRLIMGVTDRWIQIDHINGNGLDNRRCNIRLATSQQNRFNQAPYRNSSSQYKGVRLDPRRKKRPWAAKIFHNGQLHWLGMHATEVEAAQAYDRAARQLFGEFAYLNFPEEC